MLDLLSLRIDFATLIVAVVGLSATYWQLVKVKESGWSAVHSTLCDQSFELIKLCMERPSLYDYFYHGKIMTDEETDKVRVYLVSEAFANFMEQLILQKGSLPEAQWKVWERFVKSTLESSSIVGDFILDHNGWYSEDLVKVVDNSRTMPQQ